MKIKEIERHEATSWMPLRDRYALIFNTQTREILLDIYGWFYESDDGRRFMIQPSSQEDNKDVFFLKEFLKNGEIKELRESYEHDTKEKAIEVLLELLNE
jgi:hypothetical protein